MGNSMAKEEGSATMRDGEVQEPQQVSAVLSKNDDESVFAHVETALEKPTRKLSCCKWCLDAAFVILSIATVLGALAEICITITGAISTRLFDAEQSSRMVGMVLLALLAAVTISMLIYALIAVFKKQAKPLHGAALVLILTAVLQAVVLGVAIRITANDYQVLERSIRASFTLAREENPRHVQLWAATQHELTCCGVSSPYDYKVLSFPDAFPPNVPIPCCPSYDPSRAFLVQERDRETCKLMRTYYARGCKNAIIEMIETSSHLVMGLTISIILFEIIVSVLAALLLKRIKQSKSQEKDCQP